LVESFVGAGFKPARRGCPPYGLPFVPENLAAPSAQLRVPEILLTRAGFKPARRGCHPYGLPFAPENLAAPTGYHSSRAPANIKGNLPYAISQNQQKGSGIIRSLSSFTFTFIHFSISFTDQSID